jgi:hypothetical protein
MTNSDPLSGDQRSSADIGAEDIGPEQIEERAQLLPEERAVGSDDPLSQAEVILAESRERTENVDPDASSQSGRRRSEDTV